MGETDKVFVYGTLRRGFPLHEHLADDDVRFVGKGWILGRLYDLGEFPGALPSRSPGDRIEGELYELANPQAQLEELDEVEEFDPDRPEQSLFVRRLADVEMQTGDTFKAWVYFLVRKPPDARLIPSGDYAARRSRT